MSLLLNWHVFQLLTGYFDSLQGNWIIKRFNMNRAGVTQVRSLSITCMYREVIFLAKKTSELWNPSSSLILSLEKNECNKNCLFIWETVIVFQPGYSFPTTWCCISIESSLKFWRAVSKRNESKYTPFFRICNFWIAMEFKGLASDLTEHE